jgi:hypothetical protein
VRRRRDATRAREGETVDETMGTTLDSGDARATVSDARERVERGRWTRGDDDSARCVVDADAARDV